MRNDYRDVLGSNDKRDLLGLVSYWATGFLNSEGNWSLNVAIKEWKNIQFRDPQLDSSMVRYVVVRLEVGFLM
jgi:hypothetical protein